MNKTEIKKIAKNLINKIIGNTGMNVKSIYFDEIKYDKEFDCIKIYAVVIKSYGNVYNVTMDYEIELNKISIMYYSLDGRGTSHFETRWL